jgi:hypothetical protein
MLQLQRYDGVHDPIEAQNWINSNGHVVPPDLLVAQLFPKEAVFGVRISKTPVVIDIPEAGVNTVDGGERNEDCLGGGFLVHSIDTERGVEHDCSQILAKIQQVRKLVSSIGVTTKTLQSTPYSRQSCQEADDT